MDNPGDYSLGDFNITTAGTQTGEWLEDLEGMLACLSSLRFQYGAGSGTAKAYLQTQIPDGTVADVLCVAFDTASKQSLRNISATEPMGEWVPTDGALDDDSVVQGMLGTKLRLKIVTTGTYSASTLLSGRITVR